jgi:hypothetical protein
MVHTPVMSHFRSYGRWVHAAHALVLSLAYSNYPRCTGFGRCFSHRESRIGTHYELLTPSRTLGSPKQTQTVPNSPKQSQAVPNTRPRALMQTSSQTGFTPTTLHISKGNKATAGDTMRNRAARGHPYLWIVVRVCCSRRFDGRPSNGSRHGDDRDPRDSSAHTGMQSWDQSQHTLDISPALPIGWGLTCASAIHVDTAANARHNPEMTQS